ncbi:MAG: BTAD domain-containing putative transcriptional regulator [Acidimicrobiia bacterium]|nr:BTAD domain-containing putative transcriptional regulator [Acidimicrobiia bacterium]
MEFRVLGGLEVLSHGAPVVIGRARERKLLAILLSQVDKPVSVDRIFEAMWGDSLPGNPDAALQTAVSRLRRALADTGDDHGIRTGTGNYLLELGDNTLDAVQFSDLVAAAQQADPDAASALLERALGLWRGGAYADFEYEEFAQPEIRRLSEMRNVAFTLRVEVELALGRHKEIVADLQSAVAANPLDEGLWSHLMLALYRSGRQADALRTFQEARRVLVDSLGIDPSPSLRSLEEAMLRQDPALNPVPTQDRPMAPLADPGGVPLLPAPVAELVARRDEVDRISQRLGMRRLVSIVGPPGVGKSRLALEVAAGVRERFGDGAAWVPLDTETGSASFEEMVAAALGLAPTADGVRARLFDWVRGREQLLVLDGCETFLPEAATVVADLLQEARGLTVLVTTRQRLGLQSESVEWLSPFRLPDPDWADVASEPAVEMFVKRARNVVPGFELTDDSVDAVCRIVAAVDGLPLGIELAAGELIARPLDDIASVLDDAAVEITATQADRAERHQSLQRAVTSSWNLLSSESQHVFVNVALFRSGWTIDDAADLLGREIEGRPVTELVLDLADRSLISPSVQTGPQSRASFSMLDVVRRYAEQRLEESGQLEEALGRHANAAAAGAKRAAEEVRSGKVGAGNVLTERLADFRAGLERLWTDDPSAAGEMACNLSDLCAATHQVALAESLLQETLDGTNPEGLARAEILWRLGFMRHRGSDLGVENVTFSHPARAWRNRTRVAPDRQQRLELATQEFDEATALFEAEGDEDKAAQAKIWHGWIVAEMGDLGRAQELVQESTPIANPRAAGSAQLLLANLALAEGKDREALKHLDDIERVVDRWPPNQRIFVHDTRARLARANGRPAEAFHYYRRALVEDAEPHGLPAAAILHYELGFLSVQLLDLDTAQKEFSRALSLGRKHGMPRIDAAVRVGQGWLEFTRAEYDMAASYFELAFAEFEKLGDLEGQAHALAARAKIEERREDFDASVAYALRSNVMARGLDAKIITALIAEILAGAAVRAEEYALAAQLLGASQSMRAAYRVRWPADAYVRQCQEVIGRELGDEAEVAYDAGRHLGTKHALRLASMLGPQR